MPIRGMPDSTFFVIVVVRVSASNEIKQVLRQHRFYMDDLSGVGCVSAVRRWPNRIPWQMAL